MNSEQNNQTVTRETIGYTINMYSKGGGCASTWYPTLKEALEEIEKFPSDHECVIITKLPFKKRMTRMIANHCNGLEDSGYITKRRNGQLTERG